MGEKQGEAAVKGILAGYGSGGSEEENDDEESPADLGRQVVKEDKHCKLDEDEESDGSAYSPTCGLCWIRRWWITLTRVGIGCFESSQVGTPGRY